MSTSIEYQFTAEERPRFPGSPFIPNHTPGRRVAYFFVGLLVGMCTTFPNGLVTANIVTLPGSLDLYIAQISWLPAIYVAMNATANLTLVKARRQFGIPAVIHTLLAAYALANIAQLLFPDFATAVVARAINGMMAGALTSLSVYYFLQVFPPRARALALIMGLGLTQVGIPLARTLSVDFLSAENWRGLHLTELAVALIVMAATLAVPLPPNERSKAFSPLDFVTIALLVPAFLLICGVLGLGRVYWWTDAPFLGWMLATAIPLLACAILIETQRDGPLLQFRWFGSMDIVRFAAVAFMVRLALVEQTYGSVGLLTAGGLTNDQLRELFACVVVAMFAGLACAILTISEKRLPYQIVVAALIIAAGAYLDSQSTSVTRPSQLYLSQCLLGFGATFFIGPAMAFGFLRLNERGPAFYVTFVVLFSTTQNVGSLAGSAILGSYQIIESRAHATSISDNVTATNPQVIARLEAGAAAASSTIVDPLRRQVEGETLMAEALQEQAAVLAFNDVFRLVAAFGVLTACYILYLQVVSLMVRRFQKPKVAA